MIMPALAKQASNPFHNLQGCPVQAPLGRGFLSAASRLQMMNRKMLPHFTRCYHARGDTVASLMGLFFDKNQLRAVLQG
jgi:hypothetical protein